MKEQLVTFDTAKLAKEGGGLFPPYPAMSILTEFKTQTLWQII